MNLGEEEDSPDILITLDKLIEYLKLRFHDDSNSRIETFKFYNNIYFFSKLSNKADMFFWIIFFILIEILIVMSAFPTTWFYSIQIDHTYSGIEATNHLFAKLGMQVLTIFLFGVTILLMIFQQSFYKKKTLSTFNATFLYLSFLHIPLILIPITGIVFGASIISMDQKLDTSSLLYSMLLAISFTLLSCNSLIFATTTKTKLLFSTFTYDYWSYPFNFIDFWCDHYPA